MSSDTYENVSFSKYLDEIANKLQLCYTPQCKVTFYTSLIKLRLAFYLYIR